MGDLILAVLLYPLTDTITVLEVAWVLAGFIGAALAIRKRHYANVYACERQRAYDAGKVSDRLDGDRRLVSQMNTRTATMAVFVMGFALVAGIGAMTTPTRPDEFADTGAVVTLALVGLELWIVRWLVLDWRDALALRARLADEIDEAKAQQDHIEAVTVDTNERLRRSAIGDAETQMVNKNQADRIEATGEESVERLRREGIGDEQ